MPFWVMPELGWVMKARCIRRPCARDPSPQTALLFHTSWRKETATSSIMEFRIMTGPGTRLRAHVPDPELCAKRQRGWVRLRRFPVSSSYWLAFFTACLMAGVYLTTPTSEARTPLNRCLWSLEVVKVCDKVRVKVVRIQSGAQGAAC